MGFLRDAARWLFEDRTTGGIVIAQWPNLPLWVFGVASVVRRLVDPAGAPGAALDVVIAVALAWWSIDEVARGVNPFRRILGAVVLALLIAGIAARLVR